MAEKQADTKKNYSKICVEEEIISTYCIAFSVTAIRKLLISVSFLLISHTHNKQHRELEPVMKRSQQSPYGFRVVSRARLELYERMKSAFFHSTQIKSSQIPATGFLISKENIKI